ncbi:hypothetical protein C8J56DRAFT_801133 [Mycena floridula]|nr:hypothetical protein C8J56DRAFT_801133 [Mycena floridula]
MSPSNQSGELLAIKAAVEEAYEQRVLIINSDSKYVINGLTRNLAKLEDNGFIATSNKTLFRATIARLRERGTNTALNWVKGHSGIEGNERADELAGQGAQKDDQDEIDLEIPHSLCLTGAKLASLTQAIAYRAIRDKKMNRQTKTFKKQIERRETTANLEKTRYAAQAITNGNLPTNRKIWKSIRHTDLTRQTRYFFWMSMHSAYKTGDYWTRMKDPDLQARGTCETCRTLEDMAHILTRCRAPGQRDIWEMAEDVWYRKTTAKWYKPEFGRIMACGLAEFKSPKGTRRPGASRLFRIVVSEAAYLIWKIRNERTIPDEQGKVRPRATRTELENRFFRRTECAPNSRLRPDQ